MKNFIRNNKLLIIVLILGIIIISVFSIIKISDKKIKEISEVEYYIQYDNSWKIGKKEEEELELLHRKSKSKLNIKINELDDDIKYKSVDEIFDSLIYNIQEQNQNYKLISKENAKITKNNIKGYKTLFETEDSQVELYVYKQEDKLIIITYEAEHEYFDILLDSVNSIIYNFKVNSKVFDAKTQISLQLDEINYTEDKTIIDLLKDTKEDEIKTSNFLVNYSIPSNFYKTTYNTKYGSYKFKELEERKYISLDTSIVKTNIYDYLDKENSLSIYDRNLNSYNKESEKIEKLSDESLSYIYKNNYLTNNEITENISIVFELDNNHIFIVKISSVGYGIPEELVKMIKINNKQNIASNIEIEKKDGFLIGNLKRFVDYNYEKTENITLKIPESYTEIDNDYNLYEERKYAKNYDNEKQIYEYEVSYQMVKILSIEKKLELLVNDFSINYIDSAEFVQIDDIVINDKTFKVFEREYTALSKQNDDGNKYNINTKEKVLFYELENEGKLMIDVKANNSEGIDEQINKLTNFNIKIE